LVSALIIERSLLQRDRILFKLRQSYSKARHCQAPRREYSLCDIWSELLPCIPCGKLISSRPSRLRGEI
jgi:hypothetical protein